jgi:hypothetical protein
MALTAFGFICDEVYINREQFKTDPDRAIQEIADSLCPIYTSDIIAEWTELPSEHSDRWQELGLAEGATITALMTADLYLYYFDLVTRAWDDCDYCDCELPEGITISPSGTMATCDNCDYRCGHWEHACELEHDCSDVI